LRIAADLGFNREVADKHAGYRTVGHWL